MIGLVSRLLQVRAVQPSLSLAPLLFNFEQCYANQHGTKPYTDCFELKLSRPFPASQANFNRYLMHFYTSPLFKIERMALHVAGHPSSDESIRGLSWTPNDTIALFLLSSNRRSSNGSHFEAELSFNFSKYEGFSYHAFRVQNGVADSVMFGTAMWDASSTRSYQCALTGAASRPLSIALHRMYSRSLLSAATTRFESAPVNAEFLMPADST
ncbi:putative mitochondrial protein [Andalucia godoyi]|uniref:Putative mitochondrial protein n=1 Tax=Andalucia godoyi TaxID=505711 RepID=A0A8K0AJ13_ANDGO|nr:putative mitochondrial protein [Andalucia godoyi]|eukprot:ANDGO_07934.mRNA.1 putative mitochondrial protein